MTRKHELSYHDRMMVLPEGPYRDEMLKLSRQWLAEHHVTPFEDMLRHMHMLVLHFRQIQEPVVRFGGEMPGMADFKAVATQMQRIHKLVHERRDEAAYFAASVIFARTGQRLPRVGDPCEPEDDGEATSPAAAPTAPAEPEPATMAPTAPEPETTREAAPEAPIAATGKVLKPLLHKLIQHKVAPRLREEFKRQARSGRFTLTELRGMAQELLAAA